MGRGVRDAQVYTHTHADCSNWKLGMSEPFMGFLLENSWEMGKRVQRCPKVPPQLGDGTEEPEGSEKLLLKFLFLYF